MSRQDWVLLALGALFGNAHLLLRIVVRHLGLMPRPRVARVQVVEAGKGDQWLKAEVRLPRWLIRWNDPWPDCAVFVTNRSHGGGDAVPLFAAGVPEPMPEFALLPGGQREVPIAIWQPIADTVHMSRTLKFTLKAREPRFLSHSLCYGLIDRTPPLPDGESTLELRFVSNGRAIATWSFVVDLHHLRGFSRVGFVRRIA